jgi:hypothetical protein
MTDVERLLHEHGVAPEHTPGFEARLWAAIDAEDASLVADEGGRETVGRPIGTTRRRSWRRIVLVAAALAALLAVIVYPGRNAVRELQHPPVASAAAVVAKVREALTSFTTIRATVISSRAGVTGPEAFEPGWTSSDWFARASDEGPAVPVGDPARIWATADGQLRNVVPVTGASWSSGPGPDGTTEVTREVPDSLELTRDVPPVSIDTADDAAGVVSWYAPGYRWSTESGSFTSAEKAFLVTGAPLGPPDSQGQVASWMGTEGRARRPLGPGSRHGVGGDPRRASRPGGRRRRDPGSGCAADYRQWDLVLRPVRPHRDHRRRSHLVPGALHDEAARRHR